MQRGAVPPLVAMLGQGDTQLREMAAFALGRLAQNADNQAGIVQVWMVWTMLPCAVDLGLDTEGRPGEGLEVLRSHALWRIHQLP